MSLDRLASDNFLWHRLIDDDLVGLLIKIGNLEDLAVWAARKDAHFPEYAHYASRSIEGIGS